jgi:hypothetical protein
MIKKITMSALTVMCLLTLTSMTVSAQTTITIDGNMSDWTEEMRRDGGANRAITTWHAGVENEIPFFRDNAPADPENLNYLKDLNYAALYSTDDDLYFYVRVDMNPLADVRRAFAGTDQYDADMYPNGGELTLSLSVDPDLLADFADTTGMTWGWYYNGIDFSLSLYPNDSTFAADTEFDVPLMEHDQSSNEWAFATYSRRPDIGAKIKWNAEWNSVEVAIPKSILLQPVHLPNYEADGHGSYVTMMLRSAHANAVTGNQWWAQTIANDESIAGYLHTYEAEWSGAEPIADVEYAVTIDGDLSEWTEEMRIDGGANRPITTWADGVANEIAFFRDNAPADPENLNYLKDLNYAALYATDDARYFYVRVDMTPTANVHRAFPGNDAYDADMYPNGGELTLSLSIDPDLLADFADTTGMTWGWYYNGIDMTTSLYPDAEFTEMTVGYNAPIVEHSQENNEWAFSAYARQPYIGTKIAWNAEGNKVEIAIPKSFLLQPGNLPNYVDDGHGSYVTMMLRSAHANAVTGNEWWAQTIANDESIAGYLYTYAEEWDGQDPPVLTSIERDPTTPSEFTLEQNYPNPFNPTTQIRFTLNSAQPVTINVYDILGRMVSSVNAGMLSPGTHNMTFNANGLSSGIYLYTVTAGTVTRTGKMVLSK